jgi:ribosome recycling factor
MDEKTRTVNEMKVMADKAIEALGRELARLRTGRASISILDDIKVDYYGTITPLNQLATLSTPESRLINIQPWDTTQIQAIEKAILSSDLGLTPANDGKLVRIPIPQLTEERRKEIVKVARRYAEECRVSVRSARRDANEALKKLEKDKVLSQDELKKAQQDVQNVTDKEIARVEEILSKKEKEIIEV